MLILLQGIIPPFFKYSFVVGSLLVRYVNEEIAKRERSYNASTYKMCFPEIAEIAENAEFTLNF